MTHDDVDDEFLTALRHLPRYRLSDEAKARHLRELAELTSRPDPAPRRHRPRRGLVILAVAVVSAGAGVGTAGALGVFSPPTDRSIAHCYATTDLNLPGNHIDFIVATADDENPSVHNAANLALEICADTWQQGRLGTSPPYVSWPSQATASEHPVPQLIACVLPSGQVGVFPGSEDVCLRLDLHPAQL